MNSLHLCFNSNTAVCYFRYWLAVKIYEQFTAMFLQNADALTNKNIHLQPEITEHKKCISDSYINKKQKKKTENVLCTKTTSTIT